MKLVQMDFPTPEGPFKEEMAEAYKDLAESITKEPGFIWKFWTENEETKEAGGIYLFESEEAAKKYVAMHQARLESFGVTNIRVRYFDVNEQLSTITKAPLQ